MDPGVAFTAKLRRITSKRPPEAAVSGDASARVPAGDHTRELYRVPRIAEGPRPVSWAKEVITWPRYEGGAFRLGAQGESLLDLTKDEADALSIILLTTQVRQEKYGAAHQFNWKKTGITRAQFSSRAVTAVNMPTARATAAYQYLMQHNAWYKGFVQMQAERLSQGASLYISSYDLFINFRGVEAAICPVLYPSTEFTDTGILQHHMEQYGDSTNRVMSIGTSWTRKVLSSVRAYGEQRDLAFFLYEKHLANKFFAAHVRAQKMGITADVLTRDSQTSSGYWDIVQDSLADLVRIMLQRCYDEEGHKQLYDHVRGLRGNFWLCAYPNVFITIAPAEWKFPRPYFLDPYLQVIFAGAYIMALHMYYLVRCMWFFLSTPFGNRWFIVYEWVMKTEYQGRGTPHWHIAAWVVCFGLLRFLEGRTGTAVVSAFVSFLQLLFHCEIDVQVGNGRLNYINGYVAKDHDAVDVGLGEYVQKGATAPWLASYRLLSKSTPCLPEVAIRMSQLSEFERSYSHVLLYPPQPGAMVSVDARKGNFPPRCIASTSRRCGLGCVRASRCRRYSSVGIACGGMMWRLKRRSIGGLWCSRDGRRPWWWRVGTGMSSRMVSGGSWY